MARAASGALLGARPTGSQRNCGQVSQLRPPVAQLLRGGARAQPAALPFSEMAVLGRDCGKSGGGRADARRINPLEFFPEQPLRPSIRDKVMELDQERVVVFAEP